jgi:hypothetical protein
MLRHYDRQEPETYTLFSQLNGNGSYILTEVLYFATLYRAHSTEASLGGDCVKCLEDHLKYVSSDRIPVSTRSGGVDDVISVNRRHCIITLLKATTTTVVVVVIH